MTMSLRACMPFVSDEMLHDRINQTNRSDQISIRGKLNDPTEGIQPVARVMLVLSRHGL